MRSVSHVSLHDLSQSREHDVAWTNWYKNITLRHFDPVWQAYLLFLLRIIYNLVRLRERIQNIYDKRLLCLSNRIKMSKSDIFVPSCHIYVQITLYISKVQYICPKLQYVYPIPATCFRFIYNSQMILHISIQFRYKYFTDFFSIYISCGQYLM